jgi:aspartyl-tRNA synthetase
MSSSPVDVVAVGGRTDYCGTLRASDAGRDVRLCGWVASRREHGEHLAFVDLRDHTGVVQCVVDHAHDLRSEYVVAVAGTVRLRPEGTVNPALATGEVEVGDCEVEILSAADPPPFPVTDRIDADEVLRLRHRYVDLRRDRMQLNLRLRARVNAAIRTAMERQGFTEVETPLLWTPTPEGAREFAVPSRRQPGSFYVLPQSPQIAKQLLMVGGFDRYYQLARCLRDEDLRADRQFEFTQLDLEASFVGQEDVIDFVSQAVLDADHAATGRERLVTERMTWAEAMDCYGSDKPDLRFGMELVDLGPVLAETELKALRAPAVKALRLPGKGGLSRSQLDALVDRAKGLGAKGLVWARVVAGGDGADGVGATTRPQLESPVSRFLRHEEQAGIVAAADAEPGDLILAVADEHRQACTVMGQLRLELGRPPVGEGRARYVWIVDFPMFEGLDEDGRPVAAHHPFTMPNPEDLSLLESDPLRVRALAYDLVLDGWELGSGSIRVHRGDLQRRIFAVLGISDEQAEERFGFLLEAFRYGAPPHGGFAMGIDRFVAVLAGQENIREVIAFPKTQSGLDPMTGAPKPLDSRALAELGIRPAPRKG